MKRVQAMVLFALLVSKGGAAGWSQPITPSGPITAALYNLYAYWLDGVVPSGASVNVLIEGPQIVKGLDTIIEDDIAGGLQLNDFYRNPDRSLYSGPNGTPAVFGQAEFLNDFGIRQGLLWSSESKRNLLEAFLFYRAHFDYDFPAPGNPNPLILDSNFPDKVEILSNALHAGLSYDSLVKDKVHKTRDGIYVEASAEWGPRFLLNSDGQADYYRLNGTVEGFKTLYASPPAGQENRFSIYLADYFSADYAGGSSIPFSVFESFGGRYMRTSVGTTIRGFENGRFGADFKVLNNFDVRLTGPSIISNDLVPGLYAFFDAEYYDGFFDDPSNTPGGLLASTGFGAYLNVCDFLSITMYAAFPFEGRRLDGSQMVLGGGLMLLY